ncbi:MAG: DEAD/DEAH box helicase [Lachnospiraceae bacterium]|nr:DEAD/DEAH box helicase [Lachnospiraceae bacterium]
MNETNEITEPLNSESSNSEPISTEPTPTNYHDAEVDNRILRAVGGMGFETMTPIQEQAIPILMAGHDIIGQAQTGTGKTAAFGIPMIQKIDPDDRRLQAIVLCPTRELAVQAAEEIRKLAKYMHSIKVLPIYGGQEIYRQIKALSTGVQIVVGTPGRVMDHLRRHTIKTEAIKMIVLDEADEMLNMGFREDIETILKDIPTERQMALFSATMPQAILDITHNYQKEPRFIRVTPKEITIDLVKQAYYRVQRKDKNEVLCRLMDFYQPKRTLVFCNTKRMVDSLSEDLKSRGYQAEGLHGDLSQYQRDNVMNMFRSGTCQILIATDVAARGLDVSGVDAVFNYDVPDDIEYYVHRIGRTGRAGRKGRSFTLVSGREIYKIRDIERLCHTKIKERTIPKAADITRVKADVIFLEAKEVMENQNLDEAIARISRAMEQYDFTAIELAAAFMKEKMGDELAEIKDEKPLFRSERSRSDSNRQKTGAHPYSVRRSGERKSDSYRGSQDRSKGSGKGKVFGKAGGKPERFGAKPAAPSGKKKGWG